MSEERNWKRIRERLPLHLPVRVRGRETPTFEWTEITRLINVTPFGAGAKGATIFTTLQIPEGRFIRLTSDQYGMTAHAAIRSRSTGADGVPRIHVEFIDREWPL